MQNNYNEQPQSQDQQQYYQQMVQEGEMGNSKSKFQQPDLSRFQHHDQSRTHGISAKIDKRVQKFNQRDMELTAHKRRRVQHQRQTEKNHSKDRFANKPKLRGKNPYKNVESKIRHAVLADRSK